jgi:hypothetical protein
LLVTVSILGGALWVLAPARASAQKHVAPFYELPKPGAWIEYDCVKRNSAGKESKAVLRLSHLGTADFQGDTCAWVEIRLTAETDGAATWKARKLLVSVESFRNTRDLAVSVRAAYQQNGPGEPPQKLSRQALDSFVQLGFPAPQLLQHSGDKKEVQTPLGKWQARRVQGHARVAERQLQYEAWLSKDAPFGLCRFTVREQQGKRVTLEFDAVAARSGVEAPKPARE